MDFFQGFSQCWWPGSTCGVNWSAWAAIFTAAAIVWGAIALNLEAKRAHRFQRLEWKRAERDQQRQARADALRCAQVTAVLAMTIHKEAWRAISHLRALLKVLEHLEHMAFADFKANYANGLPMVFVVAPQIVDHLDGFKAMDASSILHGAAMWSDVPIVGHSLPPTINFQTVISLRPKAILQTKEIINEYGRLMNKLVPYFQDVEGIEWIEPEALIAENERRLSGIVDSHQLGDKPVNENPSGLDGATSTEKSAGR